MNTKAAAVLGLFIPDGGVVFGFLLTDAVIKGGV